MTKFWRTLARLLRSYFIAVGVLVTVLSTLLLLNLAQLDFDLNAPPELSGEAVLVIDVSGQLRRWKAERRELPWQRFVFGVRDTWVSDLRRVLTLARDDARIKAVLLDMQKGLRGNMVDFGAARELLDAFVADSDKELVAFLPRGDQYSYLLASAADRILVTPVTMLELPGPVLNLIYFGSALKKLGVGVQVVQTGDYKSLFEPFVSDSPSSATLEMYRRLEQGWRDYMVSAIARGRQQEKAEVRAWLTHSIFTATEARRRGLIDGIESRREVLSVLKEQAQVDSYINYRDYLTAAAAEEKSSDGDHGIGLVEVVGPIAMDGNEWDTVLPHRLADELEWMRQQENVRAVVVRVISPGGSAVASELIWQEVVALAATKPVVVSMGEVAASGGYYLAAGASYLLAEPATLTGSIGVVGMLPNLAGFKDEYGVSFHVVTASERRSLYNAGMEMTESDYRLLQENLDEVYRVFKIRVAKGRGLELDALEKLAGGRIFTGAQALTAGLVDGIGGLVDAFAKAKELASLDPALKYPLYLYDHGRGSLFDCLRATFDLRRCLSEHYSYQGFDLASLRSYLRLLSDRPQVLALWPHLIRW